MNYFKEKKYIRIDEPKRGPFLLMWLALTVVCCLVAAHYLKKDSVALAKCHTPLIVSCSTATKCHADVIPKTYAQWNKVRKARKAVKHKVMAEADDNYYMSGIMEGGPIYPKGGKP